MTPPERTDSNGTDSTGTVSNGTERFWELAEPYLQRPGVSRSTMMGYPCLRLDGNFFASWDSRHHALVAKLDADTVTTLVDHGHGEPFAPNGRRFREWISIPTDQQRRWADIIDQAFEHAARHPRP